MIKKLFNPAFQSKVVFSPENKNDTAEARRQIAEMLFDGYEQKSLQQPGDFPNVKYMSLPDDSIGVTTHNDTDIYENEYRLVKKAFESTQLEQESFSITNTKQLIADTCRFALEKFKKLFFQDAIKYTYDPQKPISEQFESFVENGSYVITKK